MEQAVELLDAVLKVLLLVFPVIGITGGLKGLVGSLPTLTLWNWKVPGAVIVSWVVGLALTLVANYAGWIALPDLAADPQAWMLAQWALLSGLANYFRNVAYRPG